jgi:hypothetical protein
MSAPFNLLVDIKMHGSIDRMLTQRYNFRVTSQRYREIRKIPSSTKNMISCCTEIYPNRLL